MPLVDAVRVLRNRTSPASVTEQLAMLCCETPSCFIMSSDQISFGSSVGPGLALVGVDALEHAAVGDIPEPVPFDQRRAADALQRPIVHAAGDQLFVGILPKEFAVGLVEAEQDAQIDIGRIALQIAGPVVGADEHLAVGHDRVAVALRPEPGDPLDVLRVSLFQTPVLSSNSPTFQSVGVFLASGVLLRTGEPHHWFQSPGWTCEATGSNGSVVSVAEVSVDTPWKTCLRRLWNSICLPPTS